MFQEPRKKRASTPPTNHDNYAPTLAVLFSAPSGSGAESPSNGKYVLPPLWFCN